MFVCFVSLYIPVMCDVFLNMCLYPPVCDECDREWEGDCPVHGPLGIIQDTKVGIVVTMEEIVDMSTISVM